MVGVLLAAGLVAACGGDDKDAPTTEANPDAALCSTLVPAWESYVTGDSVVSLNEPDLTKTDFEGMYTKGKELIGAQTASIEKLSGSATKGAWSSWLSKGKAMVQGAESGDSRDAVRQKVVAWADSGRAAVSSCGGTSKVIALSSVAPSVGG